MTLNRIGLFLDRDGTINSEVDFLTSPDDVVLIPSAPRVIREANGMGIRVVVITNQSGIARGLMTEADLTSVHSRLKELLRAEGASVDAIFYCPHHPAEGSEAYRKDCDCRKPRPGMLLRAREKFDLDLGRSFVIGDRCVDMEAGRSAGCTTGLVLTGYGTGERSVCEERRMVDRVGHDIGDVWDSFKGIIQSYD